MEWEQIDRLYKLIREDKEPTIQNMRLMRLAKLLVEGTCYKDEEFLEKLQQEGQLLDYFIEYVKTAEVCKEFFNTAVTKLDPKRQAGKFGDKVRELSQSIHEIATDMENMRVNQREMFKNEVELEKLEKEYKILEKEHTRLVILKEKLEPVNMENLKSEVEQLKQQTQAGAGECEELERKLEALKCKREEIEREIQNLTAQKVWAASGVMYVITGLEDVLRQGWDSFGSELRDRAQELDNMCSQYKETLKRLEDTIRMIDEVKGVETVNIELYRRHFDENSGILEHMSGGDNGSKAQVIRVVEECSSRIKSDLVLFDRELKRMIEAGEEVKRNIRRLNMTE